MRVGQLLFAGLPRDEVEPPAVQPGLQPVQRQEPERLLPLVPGERTLRGRRLSFEEPVEHDLVAVLVGVGEVQHECRIGLEPADVAGYRRGGG